MHEVLVNRLGGLSLPRKSVVRLTDRPDMTLDVDVKQQHNNDNKVRLEIRPRGYKTFFILNSTEHEFCPAHKC